MQTPPGCRAAAALACRDLVWRPAGATPRRVRPRRRIGPLRLHPPIRVDFTHSLRHKSVSSLVQKLVAKRMPSNWVGDEFRPSLAGSISPGDNLVMETASSVLSSGTRRKSGAFTWNAPNSCWPTPICVAAASGFASREYLAWAFRRATGLAPRQLRQRARGRHAWYTPPRSCQETGWSRPFTCLLPASRSVGSRSRPRQGTGDDRARPSRCRPGRR